MEGFLRDYQYDAVKRMKNGCILNGGVGTGKSRTGLYYYFTKFGGQIENGDYKKMFHPPDLYILTTAKKRDNHEWEGELANYIMTIDQSKSIYDNKIVIDSWNCIKKYRDVKNAFFIFDEDKVTGYGTWAKNFIRIAHNNQWIILSATPGDCFMDYAAVFIANGFYKNMREFKYEHVEYDPFVKNYPKIRKYHNTGKLLRLRNRILVNMDCKRETVRNNHDIICNYDKKAYKDLFKYRWNFREDKPIENAAELCYLAREISNSDCSRLEAVLNIVNDKRKVIIFYNFDYELDLLKDLLDDNDVPYSEWNGHQHQDILVSEESWVYLVQYNSGAEAWNCILTDTIVFYSLNYSYKIMEQASGRINRMNTPFHDLHYYYLKSKSPIDLAIAHALFKKKKFNETKFIGDLF